QLESFEKLFPPRARVSVAVWETMFSSILEISRRAIGDMNKVCQPREARADSDHFVIGMGRDHHPSIQIRALSARQPLQNLPSPFPRRTLRGRWKQSVHLIRLRMANWSPESETSVRFGATGA